MSCDLRTVTLKIGNFIRSGRALGIDWQTVNDLREPPKQPYRTNAAQQLLRRVSSPVGLSLPLSLTPGFGRVVSIRKENLLLGEEEEEVGVGTRVIHMQPRNPVWRELFRSSITRKRLRDTLPVSFNCGYD